MSHSGAVQWRMFLRALAEEVDSLAGSGDRDDMLRGVGRRMARLAPLPPVQTLLALEIEINETLEMIGWGSVQFTVQEADHSLLITHRGLPQIGSLGAPAGTWLAALLEGLYEAWLAQQPASQARLSAHRIESPNPATILLHYAKQ